MPHSGSFSPVRAYSSDSKDGTGLEFGFQSLGSLFRAPPSPGGRYSRPKERRAKEAPSKESEDRAPAAEAQKTISAPEKPYLRSFSPSETAESKMDEESVTQTKKVKSNATNVDSENGLIRRVEWDDSLEGASIPRTEVENSVPTGRRRERVPAKRPQVPAKPRTVRPTQSENKKPNPFPKKVEKTSGEAVTETRPNAKAWGLSQEDQNTVDSITDPSTPPIVKHSGDSREVSKLAETIPAAAGGPRLTHVKSSGEAHMVDVGDKASTKRVAIAVAHIGLTKTVYDQIVDNSNKKGDVLGIARIAGIMAAKRTSDIIPLCHPLAISRAEVDVYLVPKVQKPSDLPYRVWQRTCPQGQLVAIQARVECVGPTGVEMEAFMAVQGAALTVIDMCKAVDKTMTINGAKLVYKSGGRSGTSRDLKWADAVGLDRFTDSGELKSGVDAVPGRRIG